MKKNVYETPAAEVIEIVTEHIFAMSIGDSVTDGDITDHCCPEKFSPTRFNELIYNTLQSQ